MKELVLFVFGVLFLLGGVALFLRVKAREYALALFVRDKVVTKVNELNETQRWLDGIVTQLVSRKNQLDGLDHELIKRKIELDRVLYKLIQDRNTLADIKNDNQTLIELAAKKIREVKHEQFYVKESAVLIYEHYQHVVQILNGFVENEPDIEKLFSVLGTANDNLVYMGNYFRRHFGLTPEEYRNQKVMLGAKDKNGDGITLDTTSKN